MHLSSSAPQAKWWLSTAIMAMVALVLGSCTTPQPTSAPRPEVKVEAPQGNRLLRQAERLEEQGKHLDAALLYAKLAESTPSPQREALQIRAVTALLEAKLNTQARVMLNDINTDVLMGGQRFEYGLLDARILVNERRPQEALAVLNGLQPTKQQHVEQWRRWHQLRGQAFELSGDILKAARERIQLDALLEDRPDERLENQQTLVQILGTLPDELLTPPEGLPDTNPMVGWLELGAIVKKYLDPLRLRRQLDAWGRRYPFHPGAGALVESLHPEDVAEGTLTLNRIALILPLQGRFAKAAEAVRDGFLASYYTQSQDGTKPTVRVYNSGGEQADILQVYQQAIDDGATVVVGPLDKEGVETLARSRRLPVPTLALNYVEDSHFYAKNLFQFALSPEDEAAQTAQRAWLDGHNRAAVIYPDGTWGQRLRTAFEKRWEALGGEVVATQAYAADKNDFSTSIQRLLNLDQSNDRYRDILALVRERMHFEPRRRQDIDFVFMAAFPRQARLIPPQLRFHHAADIPVYATSHSYTGKRDRGADRDMDGVILGDMPWILAEDSVQAVRDDIFRIWPDKASQFARLYALGVDAYNVLYYLNWLRANPQARLRGATGGLYMDETNQVHRQLTWARFDGGIPRLLAANPVTQHP